MRCSDGNEQAKPALSQVMGIALSHAQFVSLGFTTFLDGLFFTLFSIVILIMFHNPTERVRRQRVKVLSMSTLVLSVAIVHLIFIWIRATQAFILRMGDSITTYYNDMSDPTYIVRLFCLGIQMVLGDSIIIWRLYVVYGKRLRVVVPPLFLVTCYIAMGAVAVSHIRKARAGANTFQVAKSWIAACFFLTMATNVICSVAIAWQIFLARNALMQRGARPPWPVIFAFIENSAIYVLGILSAFISFLSASQWEHPSVDAIIPLVGISFCLIVLQVHFHADSTASDYGREQETTSRGLSSESPVSEELPRESRSIQMTVHVTNEEHIHVSDGNTASSSYIHGLAV